MSLSKKTRAATSPAGESTDEKRQLVDGSFSDSETTILDSDFLSSTMARGSDSLRSELKSVLCDPDVLETLFDFDCSINRSYRFLYSKTRIYGFTAEDGRKSNIMTLCLTCC